MKYIYNLNLLCFLLLPLYMSAQENRDKPKSQINVVAEYLPQSKSVELRFLPDKKPVFENGIKTGFIVERADLTTSPNVDNIAELKYTKIATTRAYNKQQWAQLIDQASESQKKELVLAKDFYEAIGTEKGGRFNLDNGIKGLKEQKGKEDFEFMVFGLSAIKNAVVAKALGIRFTDINIEPGKKYLYRISLAEPDKLYQVSAGLYMINTNIGSDLSKRKIYVKTGDTELSFLWEEKDMISGAIIERKNIKTGQWEIITKAPVYTLGHTNRNGFKDKNLKNYVTYEYRFYGFTPFGKKVLFGTAKAMPRDLTPPKKPVFVSVKHSKPDEVSLKWTVQKPLDKDLKGFLVARGTSNHGKFDVLNKDILPVSQRSYIDKNFIKSGTNYYVIQAVDTAGNISSTIPAFVTLIDSIPPSKPKFLSGKIDSTGVVTLKIKLNQEKDLMGYRLYRANSDTHEFSVISEGFDGNDSIRKPVKTIFKDTVTLNSLTPYIYYKVIALDYNFNQSPASEILKIKRPDKIAPATPVFKQVKVGKDQVDIKFAPSPAKDVVAHYVYRKTNFKQPWEQIAQLNKKESWFTDRKVRQGHKYYYSIRAKDSSNNWSDYAIPILAKPYDDGVRPVVENFRLTKDKNTVKLQWTYPKSYTNVYFVIYKTDKKGRLKQYKSVIDMNFSERLSTKTAYAVKAYTKDGGQSKLSEIIQVFSN